MNRIYMCIDLKSFYASVECRERNLDPLKTNLVTYNELYVDEFYNRLKSIKSNYYIENTSFIKITEEAFFVSDDIIFRLFI